jgi:hypothetical protein
MTTRPNQTLFARTHTLDDGLRARLRLARPGDQRPLAELLQRLGFPALERELLELVRFDPHRRAVICATALVDGREQVLGFGAIDLREPGGSGTVVVEPRHAATVSRLLRSALAARAESRGAGALAA